MAAVHGLQDLVIPALQRNVQIGAELFGRSEEVEQFVGDGRGLDRRNANAFKIRDVIEAAKHRAKVNALLRVLADVHSGQHNLLIASVRQTPDLAENIVKLSATLMPPCERNDAEAAHGAAAVLYLE